MNSTSERPPWHVKCQCQSGEGFSQVGSVGIDRQGTIGKVPVSEATYLVGFIPAYISWVASLTYDDYGESVI